MRNFTGVPNNHFGKCIYFSPDNWHEVESGTGGYYLGLGWSKLRLDPLLKS